MMIKTDGGAMYHYRGFSGLEQSQQTWTGLVDEKMNIRSTGKGEVGNAPDESFVQSPLGAPSTLLAK